jgi:hypothetical protein
MDRSLARPVSFADGSKIRHGDYATGAPAAPPRRPHRSWFWRLQLAIVVPSSGRPVHPKRGKLGPPSPEGPPSW